jgi:hypothetical protein
MAKATLAPTTVHQYRSRLRRYLRAIEHGTQPRQWFEKRVDVLTKKLGKDAKDILAEARG